MSGAFARPFGQARAWGLKLDERLVQIRLSTMGRRQVGQISDLPGGCPEDSGQIGNLPHLALYCFVTKALAKPRVFNFSLASAI